MTSTGSEIILNPSELLVTRTSSDSSIIPTELAVRELPKHLIDFKQYIDSKFCYNSAPLAQAELISVEQKFAYQCQMKILMEMRYVDWEKEPYRWENSTILFSTTLGRHFDETTRGDGRVGDIWNDYQFNLPSSDDRTKERRALPHCTFLSRCEQCGGKRTQRCAGVGCHGSGEVTCHRCDGRGKRESSTTITICGCRTGKIKCSECRGSGKVDCSTCNGQGGFRNLATLKVKWHTRTSTWTFQNSFLPNKKIAKAKRVPFWTNTYEPWSKELSISIFAQSLGGETQLQDSMIQEYQEKHLDPTLNVDNKMRRLVCIIERLDFEEIRYTLDEKYVNKKDPTRGSTFRFCQYPIDDKGQLVYEDDYPLNACGCFGEKCAFHSCCCSIL